MQNEQSTLLSLPSPLQMPVGYQFDRNKGIIQCMGIDAEVFSISNTCFYPSKMLENIADNTKSYEIITYDNRNDKWIFTTHLSPQILTSRKSTILANYGIDINDVNVKPCINFIRNFINANKNNFSRVSVFDKTGWHNDTYIYPPSNENFIIKGQNLERIFSTKGDYNKFKEILNKVSKYKFAKLAIAVGLLAPLLDTFQLQNMIIHLRGRSGSGKTAIQKLVAAIYGNPRFYMNTFNATRNAIEAMANNFNDLPFIADELQVADVKEIRKLPYFIGEGYSKGRSLPNGKLQDIKYFRTIAITSGELNITKNSDTMGAKRRCLEIGNNHILDSDIASEIHKFVEQNYGLIGRQWIEFISKNKNLFINEYERFINDDSIKEKFNEKFPDHFYLTIAAFVTFKIFETNFCNITEDKAYTETMNSILELAEDLPNVAEDTNAARAVVVIRDYIEKYKSDFATENEVPSKRQIKGYFKTLKGISCTGIKRADVLAILKTANFDPNQTMREFQEESIIIVDKNRKDGTKNINFNGVSNSVVLFLNEKLDTNIESSEYSEE